MARDILNAGYSEKLKRQLIELVLNEMDASVPAVSAQQMHGKHTTDKCDAVCRLTQVPNDAVVEHKPDRMHAWVPVEKIWEMLDTWNTNPTISVGVAIDRMIYNWSVLLPYAPIKYTKGTDD